jgi:hypothetical protein
MDLVAPSAKVRETPAAGNVTVSTSMTLGVPFGSSVRWRRHFPN